MENTTLQQSGRLNKRSWAAAIAAVIVVAVIGYMFFQTKAAGFFASVDPSKSTVTGSAVLVGDGMGGKALQFGTTQPPSPNPGEVTSGVVLGRILFEADTKSSYQVQAARWQWQSLQGNHVADSRGIKSVNPKAVTTVWAAPAITRPGDPDGYTLTVKPSEVLQNHPEWILKDSSGNQVRRSSPNGDADIALDMGNVDYQKASLAFLLSKLNQDGWDGVVLDEINPTPLYAFPGPRPAKYPNDTSWKEATYAYVKYVCGGLRQNGKLCYINLGASDDWAKSVATLTDGAEVEFFVAMDPTYGNAPEAATIENGYWKQHIDWADWMEGALRQPILHASTAKENLTDYALGSYLLVTKGRSVFSASRDYGVTSGVYTAAMETSKKLGAATGNKVEDSSGVWYRDFQKGRVVVNPHNAARTFGGKTIPATSAAITLN